MANCSDNTYVIRYTDSQKGTISIGKSALITDELDIALVGKTRLEYGQIFNENVLHLLEKFACPEDAINRGTPDFDVAYGELLERPIEGQIWYNSTQNRPYVYDGVNWLPLGTLDDVGGNHGVIAHGLPLPRPVSPVTGYEFTYAECSWTVSPFNTEGEVDYMRCLSDPATSVVTMEYRVAGEADLQPGYVNYQIIGIRGNNNLGIVQNPAPVPAQSNPPTPTVTSTPAPSVDAGSPVPTPTPTPTPSPVNTFTGNMFAFEGSNIRAYGLDDTGATSISLWNFAAANPSDGDTTPLALWVNDSGVTKYVTALYNQYFRVLTWNGSTLTQVAKIVLNSKSYLNSDYLSESTQPVPSPLTSVLSNISIRAIDFGTYYIFFVNDVGSYNDLESIGNLRKYEASLQSFKFVKSGNVLTANGTSFLPRFHTAATFPSLFMDRAVDAYDIRQVGSNIKLAVLNEDMEMVFQYDSDGTYTSQLAQVGNGVNENDPTTTVVWWDNFQFFAGKTKDGPDEGHNDYVRFFNQLTSSSVEVAPYGLGDKSMWGGATTNNIILAESFYTSDRIIALSKSTSTSDFNNAGVMASAMKILSFDVGSLSHLSNAKAVTKTGVDYFLVRTGKLATQDGSTTINGLAFYSFDGTSFTYEVAVNGLAPSDYAFYLN